MGWSAGQIVNVWHTRRQSTDDTTAGIDEQMETTLCKVNEQKVLFSEVMGDCE